MPQVPAADSRPCLAVFDLDGTLTWRDTLLPYLTGYALRHPSRCLHLWRVPGALLDYLVGRLDRGQLKSRLIRVVMGNEPRARIDAWSDSFVDRLLSHQAFRPAALRVLESHRAAGDHLVLLSASPDLYVPRIGRLLGFERTLCTEIRWHDGAGSAPRVDGALLTANRRGAEKCRCLEWLRTQYPGTTVVAYGNSDSDLPHLRDADRPLLVNGNGRARRAAVQHGIATTDWT